MDFDDAISEAREIYRRMFPEEEFLPRAPDPEEIVIGEREENGEGLDGGEGNDGDKVENNGGEKVENEGGDKGENDGGDKGENDGGGDRGENVAGESDIEIGDGRKSGEKDLNCDNDGPKL